MNQSEILVQLPDGGLTRKPSYELEPDDTVFFDGPDAFASTQRIQAQLDAEIEAAGGLEAWRHQAGLLHRETA
jgi:hypothetical protein